MGKLLSKLGSTLSPYSEAFESQKSILQHVDMQGRYRSYDIIWNGENMTVLCQPFHNTASQSEFRLRLSEGIKFPSKAQYSSARMLQKAQGYHQVHRGALG